MFIYLLFLAQDGLVSLWQNEETEELYIAVGKLNVGKAEGTNSIDSNPDVEQAQDTERKAHCLALLEAASVRGWSPIRPQRVMPSYRQPLEEESPKIR